MYVRLQQWHLLISNKNTLLQTLYINGSPTVKKTDTEEEVEVGSLQDLDWVNVNTEVLCVCFNLWIGSLGCGLQHQDNSDNIMLSVTVLDTHLPKHHMCFALFSIG